MPENHHYERQEPQVKRLLLAVGIGRPGEGVDHLAGVAAALAAVAEAAQYIQHSPWFNADLHNALSALDAAPAGIAAESDPPPPSADLPRFCP